MRSISTTWRFIGMANSPPSQLPLAVQLRPDAQLSSLYSEPNQWIIQWLNTAWVSQTEQFCWIDAGSGAGLSHVLQAIAQQAEQQQKLVFYLSFKQDSQLAPDLLRELPAFDVLCLDDVDDVLGQPDWDLALLHCFNEMRAQHKQLVMGSHQALTDLQQRVLPDLWSRLSWGMRMHWHRPEHWSAVIEHVALARGLLLDAGTCQYIATRAPRDWPKIMEILQELDQAALVAKRRVTVPFIRQVLGW